MNENQDYFTRAIPEPFRILGLQLLPLSLGRYRLLKRFDCAFVSDGPANADVNDLLLGVVICSMRCAEFIELANTGKIEREVRRWSKTICPHPWVGLLPFVGKAWRRNHSFNFVEKIQLFQRYIEDAQKIPPYRELEPNEHSSGAHWSHGMEVTLRGELGWSDEEICEQPLSKAMADYFAFCEARGLINLMTPADLAAPGVADGLTPEQLEKLAMLPDPVAAR